jgi:hypothetical protein
MGKMNQSPGKGGTRKEERIKQAKMRRFWRSLRRNAIGLAIIGAIISALFGLYYLEARVDPVPEAAIPGSAPINDVDPTSGKPIISGITSVYKGYTIGHCCLNSKQEWDNQSAALKERFVRKYIK